MDLHHGLGRLVSCYRDASARAYGAEAPFTTHASGRFTGTLDYIFCSAEHFDVSSEARGSNRCAEQGGWRVEDAGDRSGDGDGSIAVLEIPTRMLDQGAAAYMPNEHCMSDPLPIAAEIPFRLGGGARCL